MCNLSYSAFFLSMPEFIPGCMFKMSELWPSDWTLFKTDMGKDRGARVQLRNHPVAMPACLLWPLTHLYLDHECFSCIQPFQVAINDLA